MLDIFELYNVCYKRKLKQGHVKKSTKQKQHIDSYHLSIVINKLTHNKDLFNNHVFVKPKQYDVKL